MKLWTDADGKQITEEELYAWVDRHKNKLEGNYELIVGVDSHLHGRTYQFITVACLYCKGRGGFYYYSISEQHKKEFKGSNTAKLTARMFYEASLAIELATELQEKTGVAPVVHIDVSPPEAGEDTSPFSDQIRGYVIASGFEAVRKPWSFVSSGIANKHSKIRYISKTREKHYS